MFSRYPEKRSKSFSLSPRQTEEKPSCDENAASKIRHERSRYTVALETETPLGSTSTLTSPIIALVVGDEKRIFAAHKDELCKSPSFQTTSRGLLSEDEPKSAGRWTVPPFPPFGSKRVSNRELVLAALENESCRMKNLLDSDDTKSMLSAIGKLGGASEDACEVPRASDMVTVGKRVGELSAFIQECNVHPTASTKVAAFTGREPRSPQQMNSQISQVRRMSQPVRPGLPLMNRGALRLSVPPNSPHQQLPQPPALVSGTVEESPMYVNAKQFQRMLQHRIERQRSEEAVHENYSSVRDEATSIDLPQLETRTNSDKQFRQHRRSPRRRRAADGAPGKYIEGLEDHNPFTRRFQFRSRDDGHHMPGYCLLDSQSQIPLAVSKRWVLEAGREADISTDFKAPRTQSLSGHPITFSGIIRNMIFSPIGSNVTYRRDFLVSDQLDTVADFIIGAKFMLEQWSVLFGKMKNMIAGWFKHKKETPEEKAEGEVLKANQEHEAYEAELRRHEKKAELARAREEVRRRCKEGAQTSTLQ